MYISFTNIFAASGDYIMCCLHMILCLTKLMFKTCILPMLVRDEMANRLNFLLQQVGVCIPKQTKVAANPHTDQTQRIKFTGAECVRLLEHWDGMIDSLVLIAPEKVAAEERGTQS